MKVFISWSGPQSKYIALALQEWLRKVIQNLNVWVSELNIEAGQRWTVELWRELKDSNFGVVCLTAENLRAPWLHFEAGALAKAVESRVCPYLYQSQSPLSGPLSQFQWKQVDKQGTKELLNSINNASLDLTQRGLRLEDFDKVFETWWPQLEEKLNAVPPITTTELLQRSPQEIIEELVELFSDQARKIFNTGPMSVDERAWKKMSQYVKITREMNNTKLSLEDHAKIQRRIDSMKAAMDVFVVAPSEESIPASDTPQDKKQPSK